MYKSLIKVVSGAALAIFGVCVLAVTFSCDDGALSLSIPKVTTVPPISGGMISGSYAPVMVRFSEQMLTPTQPLLDSAITVWDANSVPVAGEVKWEENAVRFTPAEKWDGGAKYLCTVLGRFYTSKGTMTIVSREFYFFADTDPAFDDPGDKDFPYITGTTLLKPDADSSATNEFPYASSEYWDNVIAGESGIRFVFNEDMDMTDVESHIVIKPNRNFYTNILDKKTLAIWFEDDGELAKKRTVTLKKTFKALRGEALEDDCLFEFTEWVDDLEVTAINLLQYYGPCADALDMANLDAAVLVTAECWGTVFSGKGLSFIFSFNNVFTALFPDIEYPQIVLKFAGEETSQMQSPQLYEELYNYNDDDPATDNQFNQDWLLFEYGDAGDLLACPAVDYLLEIPGGINGVHNGAGHYLKEGLSIQLKVDG